MSKLILFLALLLSPFSAPAQSPIAGQIEAGHYPRNIGGLVPNIYTDVLTTWTTPASIKRTDIVHFHIRAGGAGGTPYQGGGGSGGKVDLDLTNLPPGVVFTINVGGAGRGSEYLNYGALPGGHSWIKYNDPNTDGFPQYVYSANGGAADNSSGGGRGGQGCDPGSGGCTLPRDQDQAGDPNLIGASFLPAGMGDGAPANTLTGNSAGSNGQNTPLGAGGWGMGGGAVGPGGIDCALPCNRGGQAWMWGFDGYPGLVTVEIKN